MAATISRRRIHDKNRYGHFITFSCYRRARFLNHERARGVVVHYLAAQLKNQDAVCMGFVVMPDHVHALIRFGAPGRLSTFMNQWKRRSSMGVKTLFRDVFTEYGKQMDLDKPIWQPKYHSFEVTSTKRALEKLEYMHNNPVKAGLVKKPQDWPHGSARWYMTGKSVGVEITSLV